MYIVGGENFVKAKNPVSSEYCELDESLTFRECKVLKDSKLDRQIRPKFGFLFKFQQDLILIE